MSTTVVRARVASGRAKNVARILNRVGLTPAAAVNALYAQIEQHRGIPFAVQEDGYAYAKSEYGLSASEMDAAEKRIRRRLARERKAGTLRPVNSPDDLG
jgi:antitoxin component of RelBE/YafQ-DinJ toxin-antitoxin module